MASGESTSILADAPALQLFTSCAQRHNPDLTFTADCRQQIAQICASVDGNPLAIELAAGLTVHYSYGDLLTLLNDNLQVLQAVGRGRARRQHSIQHVLEESWLVLSPTEQETLIRLSALPTQFNRAEAMQVAGAAPATLIGLTAKSILHADGQGFYQLPRLVQRFALQKGQQWLSAVP
jgi:predicted ATPase